MVRHKKFVGLLGLCFGLSTAIVLILLNANVLFKTHQFLYWLSIFFFSIISIAAYYFGQQTTDSDNKNDFSNMFIIITSFKLLFCMFMVWLYQIFTEPDDKLYVLPFFIIYIIFTIFEMYILTKLGKSGEL